MNDVLQDLITHRPLRRFLFRTRYVLAAVLVVPLARYMQPAWFPAGVGISLVGQLIQGWCFASLVKNLELSIRGPYVLVRNPMYLGRFLMIVGFVCLLGIPWVIVAYTVFYVPYTHYRVLREERRLRRLYGDEFERYCRDVPRFIPSLRRFGDPAVRFFDWSMFQENHGLWNILLTLAAFVAVYTLHLLYFS